MNENIEFLQAFIKNPLKVGAIAPSSPELAKKMLEGIKPAENRIVLELGVGTGAITKYLENILTDDKSYLGIELDRGLVKSLKTNYPQLKIVSGNALDTFSIHQKPDSAKSVLLSAVCRLFQCPTKSVKRFCLK